MISSKSILLALSLGAFALFVPLKSFAAPVQGASATPAKFAGVYLSDFQSTDLFTGLVSSGQVLSSYSADGTLTQSDTNDVAGILSATANSNSPTYGTWKATGSSSTTQTALYFSYGDEGGLEYTVRSDWDTVGSSDLASIAGSGMLRIYLPGMDAMDESAGIPVATFTFEGRALDS